jgi:hypothetical protein
MVKTREPAKGSAVKSALSSKMTHERDSMKFSNGDVSLDKAVERNGGHIVVSNMELLFDTSF